LSHSNSLPELLPPLLALAFWPTLAADDEDILLIEKRFCAEEIASIFRLSNLFGEHIFSSLRTGQS
jgi:hypothetical protein